MAEFVHEDIEHKQFQESIKEIVENYKKTFPDEYKEITKNIKDKRDQVEIDGNEYAELPDMDAVERHAFDIPRTLFNALKQNLDQEAFNWMYARGEFDGDLSGVQWFMTEYQEFNVSKSY